MKLKKVYRIEHNETGIGPYNSGYDDCYDFIEEMQIAHNNFAHPALHKDGFLDECDEWNENLLCACPNMTAIKRWFGRYFYLLLMETYEFILVEYTVSDFKMGNSKKQLLFNLDNVIERKVIQA